MEWVNMVGLILSVSTMIVGLGSFILSCRHNRPNMIESSEKALDHGPELQRAA